MRTHGPGNIQPRCAWPTQPRGRAWTVSQPQGLRSVWAASNSRPALRCVGCRGAWDTRWVQGCGHGVPGSDANGNHETTLNSCSLRLSVCRRTLESALAPGTFGAGVKCPVSDRAWCRAGPLGPCVAPWRYTVPLSTGWAEGQGRMVLPLQPGPGRRAARQQTRLQAGAQSCGQAERVH